MRRVLLLAALAAPALAAAQSTGQVTFTEGQKDNIRGEWISLAECQAAKVATPTPAQTAIATVNLNWIPRLTNAQFPSFPGNGTYQISASTAAITGDTCPTNNSTSPDYKAGVVGDRLTGLGGTVSLQPVSIAKIFAAVSLADCETVSGDTTYYICVQAFAPSGATDTVIGIATGQIKLSVSKPSAPTWGGAVPADDGALKISWTPSTASPTAYDFVVTASTSGEADHQTIATQTSSTVMSGLTNDVPYAIKIVPRSLAGNEGPSADGTGTPVMVQNFWDVYQGTPGGMETGGCASGAAGPVALLGLAALLAKLRRRA